MATAVELDPQSVRRLRTRLPKLVVGCPSKESRSVVFRGHNSRVTRIGYSADGGLIASAAVDNYVGPAEIMVWDVQTGTRFMQYKFKELRVRHCYRIGFLPGTKASSLSGAALQQSLTVSYINWIVGPVCPPQTLPGLELVTCANFFPDWSEVACFASPWANATPVGKVLLAHDSRISALSFSPDGLPIVSASDDNSFKTWTRSSQDITGPNFVWRPEGQHINGAVFCPTSPNLSPLLSENIYISATSYSSDGKYIAVLGEDEMYITLFTHEDKGSDAIRFETERILPITTLAFSPDRQHFTSRRHQSPIIHVAFTPDCKCMASYDIDGVVCLWDIETGSLINDPIAIYEGALDCIAFSSDCSIVSTVVEGNRNIVPWNIKLWMGSTLEPPRGYPIAGSRPPMIHAMAISPDDLTLAFVVENYKDSWDLSVKPPDPVIGEKLDNALKETFPVFHNFRYNEKPLPKISFGSAAPNFFYLRQDLCANVFEVYDGYVAIGSRDGRITVLDFTPVFTPDETLLLEQSRGARLVARSN
ncbi:WD40-repeat-containing domain protein [Hysterangium stoloniferum]|nr:WD40-repeat-containing domain protein [Hysterangium stoloniferum]